MQANILRNLVAGLIAAVALIASSASSLAQSLTWGLNGVGGNGNWDTSTANWYNGTSNVTWPSGGNAIFAGASGGTVTTPSSFAFAPVVTSVTFDTPGYVLQGGYLDGSATGLTVNSNAAATINAAIQPVPTKVTSLVKNGAAPLTLGGSNFLDSIQVNQGELIATDPSSLSYGGVNLANSPGVTVTLSQSATITSISSLSGGGSSGGIVRPNNQAHTLSLQLFSTGAFAGALQDNGAGILGLSVIGNEILSGKNTYSGSTAVSGTLTLSGNGTALNSIGTSVSGILALDNTGLVVADRLADSRPVTLNQGSFQFKGNITSSVNEAAGQLTIFGACNVSITQPGSAFTQLTFAGLQRTSPATLNVDGQGLGITGVSNGVAGIVGPYITANNEWATVGGDGRITALTSYASNINTSTSSDHVKLNSGDTTTLVADSTRASLNMQNATPLTSQALDLGGKNLGISTGGILSSGGGDNSVTNGNLFSSSPELIVTTKNNLAIGASIIDNGAATALTKSGPGTLTLSGNNTYTGDTSIVQGTLVVSSDANLGNGSSINIGDGTLKAAASFTSQKGFGGVSASSGQIDTGGFDLTFTGRVLGNVMKIGDGSLTLTNPPPLTAAVAQGTLALPNGASGFVDIFGGTLQATGTLFSLEVSTASGTPALDIGGFAPSHLTTGQFAMFSHESLQVDFGIGSSASDLWTLLGGQPFFALSPGSFQFEFTNLGGATTGVNYQLISHSSSSFFPPATNLFAFAPDMAAKGWAGTFSTTSSGVFVKFNAVPVPEPQTTALMLLQGAALALLARRRLSSRRKALTNPSS